MSESAFGNVPGGQALIEWFGRVPRFHDAELQEIKLASNGQSALRFLTWEITNTVDSRGYFVLDKRVVVTITLEEVSYVALDHFHLPGIVFDLEVTNADDGFEVRWTGSYGVEGTLRAKKMRIDLTPVKPMPHAPKISN